MFDLTEARNTALKEVERIIEADPELNESEVEEVRLERETELAWIFAADIPKLINQGWAPGAITVLIEKQTGHILTEKEQINFHKNLDKTRRRAGFIREK